MRIEIRPALDDRVIDLRARGDFGVADVGKAFRTQQLLGDVLRSAAYRRLVQQPHGRRFERALGGLHRRGTKEDGTSGH